MNRNIVGNWELENIIDDSLMHTDIKKYGVHAIWISGELSELYMNIHHSKIIYTDWERIRITIIEAHRNSVIDGLLN